jgi:hypothetical protein
MNADDLTIIGIYGAEYRGIVQYYLLAGDVHRFSRLNWVMVTSLLKTLAGKYDASVSKMAAKYAATVATPHGPRRCFQVIVKRGEGKAPLLARYGGIPLRRQKMAVLTDRQPVPATRRKELIGRLLAGRCEICGHAGKVDVHQVRTLADLGKPGRSHRPEWAKLMANRRRKTLVVCPPCHDTIHPGGTTAAAPTE